MLEYIMLEYTIYNVIYKQDMKDKLGNKLSFRPMNIVEYQTKL